MRRLIAAVSLVVTALGACSTGRSAADRVGVRLGDGYIEIDAATWAGAIDLDLSNIGMFGHTLVVAHDDGTVVAATELIVPGGGQEWSLDLEPGHYQISCRIVSVTPDGTLVDHYEQGMHADVVVADR